MSWRWHRFSRCEWLEGRLCLATVEFVAREIAATDAVGANHAEAFDLDGDGDADVLSTANSDDLAWYENLDGQANFGPRHDVPVLLPNVNNVAIGDVDGDGDADLLSICSDDGRISWHPNTDGLGTFGKPWTLTSGVGWWASLQLIDLDLDGDLDLFSASNKLIVWYENRVGEP